MHRQYIVFTLKPIVEIKMTTMRKPTVIFFKMLFKIDLYKKIIQITNKVTAKLGFMFHKIITLTNDFNHPQNSEKK